MIKPANVFKIRKPDGGEFEFTRVEIIQKFNKNEIDWDWTINIEGDHWILLGKFLGVSKPPPNESVRSVKMRDILFGGKYQGVGGWLYLFCLAWGLINPISSLIQLLGEYADSNRYFDEYPALENIFMVESFTSIVLTVWGIVAATKLRFVKPNAVTAAKRFLVARIIITIISGFFSYGSSSQLPQNSQDAIFAGCVGKVIYASISSAIWLAYFNKSKRVKATYLEG